MYGLTLGDGNGASCSVWVAEGRPEDDGEEPLVLVADHEGELRASGQGDGGVRVAVQVVLSLPRHHGEGDRVQRQDGAALRGHIPGEVEQRRGRIERDEHRHLPLYTSHHITFIQYIHTYSTYIHTVHTYIHVYYKHTGLFIHT